MSKVYTFYTDSHKDMYENHFKASWDKVGLDEEFELITEYFPQESDGSFMGKGWNDTMRKKVEYILRSIEETWGDYFIHADCDIKFFSKFKENIEKQLSKKDIVAQRDKTIMCAGFFACKSNDKTKALWEEVYKTIDTYGNDQLALNALKDRVSHGFLDKNYFNYSFISNDVWKPSSVIENGIVPRKIILHHANWTVGVDNKVKMLELMDDIVYGKDS